MTAQPFDYIPGPSDRPRTVGAIRRALPADQRARFQTALDEADPADLFGLVALWAAVAQAASHPGAEVAAAVRAGELPVYEIGDVLPALTGMM